MTGKGNYFSWNDMKDSLESNSLFKCILIHLSSFHKNICMQIWARYSFFSEIQVDHVELLKLSFLLLSVLIDSLCCVLLKFHSNVK